MSTDLDISEKSYIPRCKTFKGLRDLILRRKFRVRGKTYVVLHHCNTEPKLISFMIKNGVVEKLGTINKVSTQEHWDSEEIPWYQPNSTLYLVKRRTKNLTVAKTLGIPEGIPIPLDVTIEYVKKVIKDRTFEIKEEKYAAIWYGFGVPRYIVIRMVELGYLEYAGKLREVVIKSGITWDPNNYKDGNAVIAGNANVYKILKNPEKFFWR